MESREDVYVKDNVNVQVRRFQEDPDGDIVLEDGRRGTYGIPENLSCHNLLTTAGRDFLHAQGYSTGPGANGGNYIALTTDSGAASAGDTTLASEIATNGLSRAIGAYAHSSSTNTTTVSKTFTASGTHTAVQKSGLFTAASVGTLVHEAVFTSVNLLSGDTLAITWTITLG